MPPKSKPADDSLPSPLAVEALAALRARTPARLVVGRAGAAYRTATQLDLREDHAIAVDAVHAELDLLRDFGQEFIARHALFEIITQAADKSQYLKRPELGRKLSPASLAVLTENCPRGVDLQVAIGDGLSAAAVAAQVPALLPLLEAGAKSRGWTFGRPFAIRYCRVGVLNDVGAAARSPNRRPLDRRAPRPGHRRKPLRLPRLPPPPRPHRRAAQPGLQHPRPRHHPRNRRPPHPGLVRRHAPNANQWRRDQRAIARRAYSLSRRPAASFVELERAGVRVPRLSAQPSSSALLVRACASRWRTSIHRRFVVPQAE